DPPALLLRIRDTLQRAEELLRGIDVDEPDVALPGHDLDHAVALATAQQAVVDEHAGELVADSAVHESRRHRRIDSSAQCAQHPRVADTPAHVRDRALDEGCRFPGAGTAADIEQEIA